MGQHSKWSTFERELLLKLSKASETVGEVGQQQLKESIDEVVYQAYSPTDYERTYELRESSIYDKTVINDGIEIGIFNNVQQIHPHDAPEGSSWGQHQDIDGRDTSQFIPEWTAKGHGGLFTMGERNYFKDARSKLKAGRAVKALRDGLKKQGIDSI